jgi:hypothetical protein
LSQLQHKLSETLNFWERFNSQNGDINFFLDMNYSQLSLSAINETFETLEDLQRTLDSLLKSCEDYANAVSLSRAPSVQALQYSYYTSRKYFH